MGREPVGLRGGGRQSGGRPCGCHPSAPPQVEFGRAALTRGGLFAPDRGQKGWKEAGEGRRSGEEEEDVVVMKKQLLPRGVAHGFDAVLLQLCSEEGVFVLQLLDLLP